MLARQWFSVCTHGFTEVVSHLDGSRLDAPGLGRWDVRALLGHTTRAFLTIETYLAGGSTATGTTAEGPVIGSAADYYREATKALTLRSLRRCASPGGSSTSSR